MSKKVKDNIINLGYLEEDLKYWYKKSTIIFIVSEN
jgi:hypothetical protein